MEAMMQQIMMQQLQAQAAQASGMAGGQAQAAATQQAQQQAMMQQMLQAQGGQAQGGPAMPANAMCSTHYKNRSTKNLMDDNAGGYRCQPGMECQTGGGGGGKGGGKPQEAPPPGANMQRKVKICTYFEAGSCSRAGACTFAHGEHEIGTYADPNAEKGDGGKNSFVNGDWNCPGCGDHQFARNTECRKCHTPNPGTGGQWAGGGGGVDPAVAAGEPTMTCSVHGQERGVMSLTNDGQGGIMCKPEDPCGQQGGGKGKGDKGKGGKGGGKDGWQKKLKLCTYFEQGSCGRGANCTFAHGEAEVGTYVGPGGETAPAKGKEKGGGMLPGDWACPGCGDHQFARNTDCRKCGTPNPAGGGAPRSAPY